MTNLLARLAPFLQVLVDFGVSAGAAGAGDELRGLQKVLQMGALHILTLGGPVLKWFQIWRKVATAVSFAQSVRRIPEAPVPGN